MAWSVESPPVMSGELAGTRALVVGASRGMGEGVVRAFADEGASTVAASRSTGDLEAVAEDVGDGCVPVRCDLRDAESVDGAVERAVEELGGLDVVFNSAGVLTRGPLHEAPGEDLEFVVDVNLLGAMRLSRAALPALMESGGTLLHVSSEAGERGVGNLPAYCASKGGLNALVRQLAVEYGPHDVNVNAIAPGTTKTSMNEAVRERDPDWVEERREGVPLGRLGSIEDVSDLAVFLASGKADYITGEVVNLDGGSTA